MQEWIKSRLLYLEWAIWPGLVMALPLFGAALSGNYLTKSTLLGILGASLVAIGARMKQTPREVWEDSEREREIIRRKKLKELDIQQDKAIDAVQKVSEKIQEVKDEQKGN